MPIAKNASEAEVEKDVSRLKATVVVKGSELRSLGAAVPESPSLTKGDIVQNHSALEDYDRRLDYELRRVGATAPKAAATPASAQVQHVSAALKLNTEEVRLLSLTEKINLASGRLSNEQARELIATRQAKQQKPKAENLTEKLRAASKTAPRDLAAFPNLD